MNHAKFCLPAQAWSTANLNDSDVLLRICRVGGLCLPSGLLAGETALRCAAHRRRPLPFNDAGRKWLHALWRRLRVFREAK
jgi:hypothetical protein